MNTTTTAEANQCEYIQYAQEVEQALSQLEATLHNCDDPEKIITNMLVAATEFYDGDWAGIMDADLTMKVWSTLWWYNRRTQGMTPNSFTDLQEGEYLTRWIESLLTGTPMIIENIEDLAETSELEYSFLKSVGVQTVIAVPFWKRPTGFLIVRNPKRYLNRSSLLQMMAFVAVSSVNEKRLMDCIKLKLVPETIKKDTDIIINVFDELQIITSKGIITDKELKSPKISKLIVYLLLHTKRPASPYEIVRDLWPDDDPDKAGINVKSLVYRLQQIFSLVSDYRLIESTGSGYWLTPDLNIMSDLNIFDDLWHEAQITADPQTKGHLLEKAMDLYKGGPIEAYRGEHWFMPTVAHYALRYTGIINQLLSNLNRANDYVRILEYANTAIKAIPGSADAFYWVIYAMNHLGMGEVAKNELKAAKQVLTENDYEDLLQKLNMSER